MLRGRQEGPSEKTLAVAALGSLLLLAGWSSGEQTSPLSLAGRAAMHKPPGEAQLRSRCPGACPLRNRSSHAALPQAPCPQERSARRPAAAKP